MNCSFSTGNSHMKRSVYNRIWFSTVSRLCGGTSLSSRAIREGESVTHQCRISGYPVAALSLFFILQANKKEKLLPGVPLMWTAALLGAQHLGYKFMYIILAFCFWTILPAMPGTYRNVCAQIPLQMSAIIV